LIDEMLKVRLAGGRDAPSRARSALRSLNGSLAGLAEPVRLLVSELVTNSVKHGGAGPRSLIEVVLTASRDKVRVEVADPGPGFEPQVQPHDCGGFGFLLVDRLADRWGVQSEQGSRVWFEIDRPEAGAT
jgi:anti-sigma regulatory factor (Ser/Thr protein kinase)